jgi:hypothetical protein
MWSPAETRGRRCFGVRVEETLLDAYVMLESSQNVPGGAARLLLGRPAARCRVGQFVDRAPQIDAVLTQPVDFLWGMLEGAEDEPFHIDDMPEHFQV